jgi:hypothetical protein
MRRLFLFTLLLPSLSWLLWASCESDNYRDVLPLRSFDAGSKDGGGYIAPDLATPQDMTKPPVMDMAVQPDLTVVPDGSGSPDGAAATDAGNDLS